MLNILLALVGKFIAFALLVVFILPISFIAVICSLLGVRGANDFLGQMLGEK